MKNVNITVVAYQACAPVFIDESQIPILMTKY